MGDMLSVDDLDGATFGIQDSGVAGGMLGTAVINPPASAVLGTNAVTKRASVVGGKVVAKSIMYLSLTYDHRLIDGREVLGCRKRALARRASRRHGQGSAEYYVSVGSSA